VAFTCSPGAGADDSIAQSAAAAPAVPTQKVVVVNSFPHDPGAFTQGLLWHDGSLFEGTGLEGQSTLREVTLSTGAIVRRASVPAQYFGEGIAIIGDKLYELTWRAHVAFVYDVATFKQTGTRSYTGEGWGLTTLGDTLIMSDGTSRLRFLDPATFAVRRTLDVTADGDSVRDLNELEMIRGEIWANVWQTDRIARIDPATGHVVGWVDLRDLLQAGDRAGRNVDVLNGIAYDADRDRIFVTGKLWPRLFEIRLQ
jgi:glutaminyl-peptide cyclotransferase